VKAWHNRDSNPNQYYYRFNAPGEAQSLGKWTPAGAYTRPLFGST